MQKPHPGSGLLLILAILLTPVLTGWVYGRWREWRIASHEREASVALRRIANAEADFREHDRDGNRVYDFWVADVAGLQRYGSLADPTIARADASHLPSGPPPVPRSGYYFIAMKFTEGRSPGVMAPYGQDTDGSGRKVHNPSEFAFCAYPAVYGVSGRKTYIVSEGGTMFLFDTGGTAMITWPYDGSLTTHWEHLD